jgi:phage head maturation protease
MTRFIEQRRTVHPFGGTAVERRWAGQGTLSGYGAVFYQVGQRGTEYPLALGVVERIMPGVFDRAVREDDTRILFNHSLTGFLAALG